MKRFLIILFSASLVAGLVGCGGGGESEIDSLKEELAEVKDELAEVKGETGASETSSSQDTPSSVDPSAIGDYIEGNAWRDADSKAFIRQCESRYYFTTDDDAKICEFRANNLKTDVTVRDAEKGCMADWYLDVYLAEAKDVETNPDKRNLLSYGGSINWPELYDFIDGDEALSNCQKTLCEMYDGWRLETSGSVRRKCMKFEG